MSKDREIKPVSFSKKKKDEKQMLKHVQDMNFSNYVKRLIFADMNKGAQNVGIDFVEDAPREQISDFSSYV